MASRKPALKFTKMHALGNDFIVLDAITRPLKMTPERAQRMADRHTGIGCDQILLVEPPSSPDVDFDYRIFNQDGSEVNQCGNGARCFAKYVYDRKLTGKKNIRVQTKAGKMELLVNADHTYTAILGVPEFAFEQIPYKASEVPANGEKICLRIADESLGFWLVSLGNPHAVIEVDSAETAEVERIGTLLQNHPNFPESVNVGFMQILNRHEISLRVFERGAGETLACGSGACAAAISGINNGLLDSPVTVNLALGKLKIEWAGPGQAVKLSGPATSVFHGQTRI